MPDLNLNDALRANVESANKALDSYLESVIDAKTYHALHDSAVAAKAAYESHQGALDDDDIPPVIGERYRDTVARILRAAQTE